MEPGSSGLGTPCVQHTVLTARCVLLLLQNLYSWSRVEQADGSGVKINGSTQL